MTKRVLDGEFDASSVAEKAKAAREVIQRSSLASALLAVEPIPLLDVAIVNPIEHRMVQSIARLHGYQLDRKEIAETFAMLRGRLIGPNAAIAVAQLITLVPIFPDLIAATLAYALTAAIGDLGDRYFRTGRSMSSREVKASFDAIFRHEFKSVYTEGRDDIKALFRNPRIRDRIGELKRRRRAGTMDPVEVAQEISEILNEHGRRADLHTELGGNGQVGAGHRSCF
jgi:uncharacterized protein (DUF697 family)